MAALKFLRRRRKRDPGEQPPAGSDTFAFEIPSVTPRPANGDEETGAEGSQGAETRDPPSAVEEPPVESPAVESPAVERETEADPIARTLSEGSVRGILRWLLAETDAESVAFLQVAPNHLEQLRVEPRGLPSGSVADLARKARESLVSSGGDEQADAGSASSRWLGVGGSKVLLLMGASPIAAAEPIRFARFVIEWLAASRTGEELTSLERIARQVPGVVWAEATGEAGVRVLAAEGADLESVSDALAAAMPSATLQWANGPSIPAAASERRALLLDVHLAGEGDPPSAEVMLRWEGKELKGLGHADPSLVGRHLAAARGALDALKPLIHGDMDIEHLQVSMIGNDVEILQVTVLVGNERLVGAILVRPDEEERSGAKAVLDAVNRRLVWLAGQSGRV